MTVNSFERLLKSVQVVPLFYYYCIKYFYPKLISNYELSFGQL